jgi:hypothetical protein
MLEEVGEPYDTVLLDFGTTMKEAGYLAIRRLRGPAARAPRGPARHLARRCGDAAQEA